MTAFLNISLGLLIMVVGFALVPYWALAPGGLGYFSGSGLGSLLGYGLGSLLGQPLPASVPLSSENCFLNVFIPTCLLGAVRSPAVRPPIRSLEHGFGTLSF